MTRAEKRRAERESQKAKTATYNLTQEQIDIMVREKFEAFLDEEFEKVKAEITNEAINNAMILLFTLPLEVLKDHYWKKTAYQKLPGFTELVLEYYQKWQNDELDVDRLREDLWEYGGMRLEAEE